MTNPLHRWLCRIGAAGLALSVGCVEPEPEPEPQEILPEALVFPPPIGTVEASADTWYADCGNGLTFAMADLLPAIAEGMAAQRIPYGQTSPDEWRDCSGNFLRLSSYVASACPGGGEHLAAPPGITDYVRTGDNVPALDPLARSSRELARWYHEQGRFVPIWYDRAAGPSALPAVLEENRYLLKPGAVLWFSRKRPLEEDGLEQLFVRNARATHIHHVGTVVGIEHDDDGYVIGYAMYHGANPGRAASVTDQHRVGGAGGGPPFGNGAEYLVGIGTLLPIASPP